MHLLELNAAAEETEDAAGEAVDPEFAAWVAARDDAAPHPEGGPRHFYTTVAGVSFPNDDGTDRQALLAAAQPRDPLLLVREPRNPRHPNAVKVMTANAAGEALHQLGYLPRRAADELAPLLARGERFPAAVCARREAGIRMDAQGQTKPLYGLAIVVFHGKR